MGTGRVALEGIRVLDVTQVMAGPFCAMQLCDMGADVIKVEPPEGDSTRRMAGASAEYSAAFDAVNRGKRGIVLDLKSAAGQQVFRRLLEGADILIENYRPGVMREFGLDYPSVAASHPSLIYASISGYGQTGPDASKGGFDLIAQGVSGIMSVTGEPGGPPVKAGVPLTDLGAGLFALAGILAALHYRTRTGRGQYLDTSLVEAGLALSVWEAAQYFAEGSIPGPLGSAHRMLAPYQAVRCADGYITIGAGGNRLFQRFCRVLGEPGLSADPAYANDTLRVRNLNALVARIETITTTRPRAYWLEQLESAGVPCGPINNYAEAFADRQVLAREMVVELDHPVRGRVRTPGSPLKLSETPAVVRRPAPQFGQHTREVLLEAGCTEDEVAAAMMTASRDRASTRT
ncbi:MAG TPA: CoA transferase [Vicinamibacterales bacterium]|nr:CoA transferase [Vicinamibacterales bacterium]